MSMFENEISPANPKNANARIKCIKYVDSYKYCCWLWADIYVWMTVTLENHKWMMSSIVILWSSSSRIRDERKFPILTCDWSVVMILSSHWFDQTFFQSNSYGSTESMMCEDAKLKWLGSLFYKVCFLQFSFLYRSWREGMIWV